MNKHDFVRLMAVNEDLTVDEATEMTNSVLKGISEALKKEESLNFVGFGKFDIVQRAARKGRNPKTGEELFIPAQRKITFKPGKHLNDHVLNESKQKRKRK